VIKVVLVSGWGSRSELLLPQVPKVGEEFVMVDAVDEYTSIYRVTRVRWFAPSGFIDDQRIFNGDVWAEVYLST